MLLLLPVRSRRQVADGESEECLPVMGGFKFRNNLWLPYSLPNYHLVRPTPHTIAGVLERVPEEDFYGSSSADLGPHPLRADP